MKPRYDYAIYGTDADGSERKLTTLQAASEGHAISKARMYGYKNATCAVLIKPVAAQPLPCA